MAAMELTILGLGLAAADARAIAPLDYRLPDSPVSIDRCRRAGDEDILVCGRRHSQHYRVGGETPPEGMDLRRRSPFDWDLGGGGRAFVDVDRSSGPTAMSTDAS